MAAKTQDAAGETGTMCVCGHEQAKHYFGDEMHTACQAQSVSSREPCRCREYLPVQPPATPRETALAAPTSETAPTNAQRLAVARQYGIEAEDSPLHGGIIYNASHEDIERLVDALAARVPAPSAPQEPRGEPGEGMVEARATMLRHISCCTACATEGLADFERAVRSDGESRALCAAASLELEKPNVR